MSCQRLADNPSVRGSRGFTLIELVVVIVILGVLAATALPRFVDLRAEAEDATTAAIAAALTTAYANNHAVYMVSPAKAVLIDDAVMCNNDSARTNANRVLATPLPAGYTIASIGEGRACDQKSNHGKTGRCSITGPGGISYPYVHVCAGGTN